jgi:dTDP-L-rhamnose 4-epimerase
VKDCILITGGAGFVGSHLADRLLREGYRVRVLDNLAEQVHGGCSTPSQPPPCQGEEHGASRPFTRQGEEHGVTRSFPRQGGRHSGTLASGDGWPRYLDKRVEKIAGDIRDAEKVKAALQGVRAVFHLAAAVGVGQSMYQIEHYTDVNNRGTAVLLETLIQQPVDKLVVASSMSLYGEGLYEDRTGRLHAPNERDSKQLKQGQWEIKSGAETLRPVATPESKTPFPSSVYALSKYDQERLCLMAGSAYNMPTTALRFFNIYGPRQALSNPYTGVLAIFASRFLNDKAPVIFEDGHQRRDFVSVHDIIQACLLALESDAANQQVFNVGSGKNFSINEIARKMGKLLNRAELTPQVTGDYRVGDIRHCFADIGKAQKRLGYQPQITLDDGLAELAEWLRDQRADDQVDAMRRELANRGLSL